MVRSFACLPASLAACGRPDRFPLVAQMVAQVVAQVFVRRDDPCPRSPSRDGPVGARFALCPIAP